jgi:hypothetical protein
LALALCAALLAGCLLSASGAQASQNSDIPGLPLPPSGIIEAQVGGPIVDLVYAIQVPAASVLIATVRGEPGAELGLYAFGSGSDSVLTDLPLTSSAKPGGIQTISIRVIREDVIFLNVNGRNVDRGYLFTLRASIIQDSTPPTIRSISAADRSQSSEICFDIRSADPISGITSVSISDSQSGIVGNWLPFTGNGKQCIQAAPGDGVRTFTIKVRNGVDLESRSYGVGIIVDDTPPSLLESLPSSGLLLSPRTVVRWKFAEQVRTVESLAQSVRVFRQDGLTVSGTVQRSSNGKVIRWTPSRDIPLGTVLVASLGAVQDVAGNLLEFTETRVLTRKRNSVMVIRQAEIADVSTIVINVPSWLVGDTVSIEQRSARGWLSIGRVSLRSEAFKFRVNVSKGARIRVTYDGSDRFTAVTSNILRVR